MKEILRSKIRALRDDLDKQYRSVADKAILDKLISNEAFTKADTVMTYVSMGSEVDTTQIIRHCFKSGKIVAVPVVVRDLKILKTSYISSFDDLQRSSYGILEPTVLQECPLSAVDFMVIPAIAYDLNRHRIGYGAGFYDRLLDRYNGYKAGICYDVCIVDNIFPGRYDVPADVVITDKRVI